MSSKYQSFSYGDQDAVKTGIRPQIIWQGSWSSGNISAPMANGRTMFLVYMEDTSAVIPAFYNKIVDNGNVIETICGIGGEAVDASHENQYSFACTLSGTTLTMIHCHKHAGAGSRTAKTVVKIAAVF